MTHAELHHQNDFISHLLRIELIAPNFLIFKILGGDLFATQKTFAHLPNLDFLLSFFLLFSSRPFDKGMTSFSTVFPKFVSFS